MKPQFASSLSALAASALFLAVSSTTANAADYTWDTTSGDGSTITAASGTWSTTGTNWNSAGSNLAWSQLATGTASHNAIFAGTDGTYAVTLSGTTNAQSITFNNSGYTLSSGTLTLQPTGTTNGNITVAANKTATINSAIVFANNAATSITSNAGSTLNLGGGASNSQYRFLGAGTINMTSGTYTANVGRVNVGTFNQTGGTFVMNLPSGTAATPDGYFIGDAAGRNVAYTMSGSSIINARASGTAVTNAFVGIGRASGTATNTVNVQGAANLNVGVPANTSGELWIASDNNSNGTLNVSGSSAVTVGTGKAANKIYFFRNGAGAGNSANLTQSGGTVTANGIQFGGAAGTYDATSSANLTLSGGILYVGLQGITRGAGASALQSNIKLQGGVIGASDNWSSSLDMKLGTTSGGPTFQAATSGGISKDITLSGILSDDTGVSGKLTKTGAGTLWLSGSNTYSGDTTISAGTLRLGASNVIADGVGKGNVSVASGATFDLSGFSETINGLSGAGTVDNTLSDFGATLTVGSNAGGTFSGTIKNTTSALAVSLTKTGNTDLILSGSNSYNGATTINQGRLFINSANSLSANTAVTVNGGSLVLNASGTPTFAQSITLANNSNLSARQAATVSNVTLATNGTLTFNQDDTTTQALTVNNGTTALNGTLTVQVGGGAAAPAAVTLSGILSGGSGNLVKIGSGQLTLSGSNSFNGLTIRNGTLNAITSSNALGAGTVSMGGAGSTGASLTIGRSFANNITINAPDSGSVVIGANGAGSGYTLTGGIALNGNLTLQTNNNVINGATKAGGIITGGITGTGNVVLDNIGLAANTLAFTTSAINHTGSLTLQGSATGDTTIGSVIGANVTSVTQNSATSRMVLSAGTTHSYTGATNVTAGTLVVNGNISTSTLTTVSSGATLGGSGTLGAVTVAAGGTLAPGNSPGTLNTGTLTLNDTSVLSFELNPTNQTVGSNINDLVSVTGNLTLDGILNVVATSSDFLAATIGTTWRLFNYTGSLTNNGVTLGSMPTLGDVSYVWEVDTSTAGQVNLVVVPEPGAALLGGLGVIALLRRRRD
jgi:autotransporter-associated beta strand protein